MTRPNEPFSDTTERCRPRRAWAKSSEEVKYESDQTDDANDDQTDVYFSSEHVQQTLLPSLLGELGLKLIININKSYGQSGASHTHTPHS